MVSKSTRVQQVCWHYLWLIDNLRKWDDGLFWFSKLTVKVNIDWFCCFTQCTIGSWLQSFGFLTLSLQEEELRNIIEMGRSMEDVYGHYFDCVIIHYDHERAYRDLTTEIQRIQTEPQWVPIKWIRLWWVRGSVCPPPKWAPILPWAQPDHRMDIVNSLILYKFHIFTHHCCLLHIMRNL